ncbi:MAG: GntR family transcriptional regulator [Alphaproteobacteria bacterium]|nr:GntR family transcriptional regulator [Alphaproteobacteria bacterium]MCZ6587771.1 GntR family transcriptional regulator [Alphaproteobacteria bacterium]MCZ6592056.1 GntR family transcriptional regulator [Alphaproteobacteria bacterium]MCZ6838757.1 GntR family transcriptional regulator [Alphaproteobacteria bacterium]
MAARPSSNRQETRREQVYREVRRALMGGSFEPGQKITVASLASALGVSAMPVREALRRLAAERALEMQPNRSVRVPRLSRTDILKLREVRELIEGYAVFEAAHQIISTELGEVTQLMIALMAARARQDGRQLARLNEEFHFTIYRAARVPVLTDIIATLWLHSAPTLSIAFRPEFLPRYPSEIQNHNNRALINALKRGDGDGAAAALRAEIAEGSRILDAILREIDWDSNPPTDKAFASNELEIIANTALAITS